MQAPESAAALVKQDYGPHLPSSSEKGRWSAVASAAGLLSKS
jgi:hypothetical protein